MDIIFIIVSAGIVIWIFSAFYTIYWSINWLSEKFTKGANHERDSLDSDL